MLLVLYLALSRVNLVPHALARFGVLAVLLQITGIGVAFFRHDLLFPLLASMAWLRLFGCSRNGHHQADACS